MKIIIRIIVGAIRIIIATLIGLAVIVSFLLIAERPVETRKQQTVIAPDIAWPADALARFGLNLTPPPGAVMDKVEVRDTQIDYFSDRRIAKDIIHVHFATGGKAAYAHLLGQFSDALLVSRRSDGNGNTKTQYNHLDNGNDIAVRLLRSKEAFGFVVEKDRWHEESPSSPLAPRMKLEELVQKLEDVKPWTHRKVEFVLNEGLSMIHSVDVLKFDTTRPLLYDEGLIIEKVHLRLKTSTGEMIRLIVEIGDDASCFSRERINKTYPDLHLSLKDAPHGHSLNEKTDYKTTRPWGAIAFGFKERRPDCLSSIVFIPKEWE